MLGTDRPAVRVHWLLLVLAIMILLTAGWPLLNLAAADRHRVHPGTVLAVGTDPADSARITVGPGWSVRPAESNPMEGYSLQRGHVVVRISYINLVEKAHQATLWSGLRAIMRLGLPGVRLSRPVPTMSAHGSRGVTGSVSDHSLIGTAAIFPGPSGQYAVEIVILAPRAAPAGLAAAQRMMRSVRFAGARR
jgi:hypothetical protein